MKINKLFTQNSFQPSLWWKCTVFGGYENWGADKFSKNSKFSNELYEGGLSPGAEEV